MSDAVYDDAIDYLLRTAAESSTRACARIRREAPARRREALATAPRFRYLLAVMGIASSQNLVRTIPVLPQPYGIRVRLRPGDPFAKLLGTDWQKTHWFFTAAERDRVLEDMSRKHEYSRIGDQPALVFEKVEKLAESRGL
jgi:hypothetical protein